MTIPPDLPPDVARARAGMIAMLDESLAIDLGIRRNAPADARHLGLQQVQFFALTMAIDPADHAQLRAFYIGLFHLAALIGNETLDRLIDDNLGSNLQAMQSAIAAILAGETP